MERSARQSGLKAVLIGHSKGGYVGRAIARLRPDVVSHVIALGSPYQDPLDTNWLVRSWVETAKLWNRVRVPADRTEPDCYEVHCPCGFGDLICGALPADVGYTAIYTREDGVTSWEKCIDLNGVHNIAVPGTHIGLPVNRNVYRHLASILPGIAAQPLPRRPA